MSYNILAVIDGSDSTLHTITSISQLIQGIPDAMIQLLYVDPVPLTSVKTKDIKTDYSTMVVSKSEHALKELIDYLKSARIPFQKKVVVGNLIQEIKLNVKQLDCKMVVLTHKDNHNPDMLVNSVINKVSCPVVVIPNQPNNEQSSRY